ncbi:hypothetical protein CA233_09550 [Sphingomonas sp. ABOLD]|uniref:Uncharacterized protein n=1 Tax=Sphingomonas trueperi TaxID=53317 RepID=A0A7X5Y1G9_9SPHN|nr:MULTISPECIES: hypothetical protein [Sphingomonas]NJB99337.1 hypothetical protein [Sphingomonas trueperi]RSV40654.1 hypothetical protein CA234_11130 [Sphingomonas sp. ABOLE]RSV48544.1 hypothetical protein CA233_09550 [Sphingomonas sp. ABOLD]
MPADSRFVGNSIEELLVALAEGLREAQSALDSGQQVDASGRPVAGYHLPFLDFTINVNMSTQTDSGGRPIALMFQAAPPQSSTTTAIQSNITGRLVAIPPGNGLPVPNIVVTTGVNIGGEAAITVKATNSAGELLVNQAIEINIDDAASAHLSAGRGRDDFSRAAGTRLKDGLLSTGPDGIATTRLIIGKDQRPGIVALVANIGPYTARGAVPLEMLG